MEGRGFPRAGRAAPSDFPRGKPEENPWRAALPAQKNPVLPESFTQIYILFPICFRIDTPKMHRWFRICLPKFYDCSVWALLKSIEGSILALLRLPWIFSHKNSTVREFCVPWLLCKKTAALPFFSFSFFKYNAFSSKQRYKVNCFYSIGQEKECFNARQIEYINKYIVKLLTCMIHLWVNLE